MEVTNASGSSGTFAIDNNRYLNSSDLTLETTSNELVNNRFYIYPNPVLNILFITNQDKAQLINRLAIISLQGRLLFEQNAMNTNITQVDLASFPQGMYFCKITSNNQSQIVKFLKQ